MSTMRRRHLPFLLATLALWAFACGGGAKQLPASTEPDMRKAPFTVTYADGAANVYIFAQDSADGEMAFEYVPVTPEQSSTGRYSGGAPVTTRVPAGDPRIDELWSRIEELEADPALRAPARNKGTGAFYVKTPAGKREFIIEMGPAVTDFDVFVKQFRR
jgi:hypothetical protein